MSQTVINLGTGGASLNGTLGSTSSADSNDPKFLAWPGDNNGNYVYITASTGIQNYLYVSDEAALDITGDIDLRVYCALDDWTPSGNSTFVGKYSATQQSYQLRYITSSGGRLQFVWSEDGTTTKSQTASVSLSTADSSPVWLRATLDVDNGSSQHEVKFFTSPDGETWTQLGTTLTGAGTTSVYSGTANLTVGTASVGSTGATGKFYRAQVLDGIDGTTVLDIDTSRITSGSTTSFTAITGQTVTIARATGTSRRTVAVVSPVWVFGTDDYIEVLDNSLIDFTNTESFSLVAVYREWANFGTNNTLIAKKADTTDTTQGYYLGSGSSTAAQTQGQVGDGAAGATATETTSRTSGTLYVSTLVRNVTADTITTYLNNSAGTPVTDATTTTSANTEAFRIGRLSGAGTEYSQMELVAVAVFRKALTATEISRIVSYYQTRLT